MGDDHEASVGAAISTSSKIMSPGHTNGLPSHPNRQQAALPETEIEAGPSRFSRLKRSPSEHQHSSSSSPSFTPPRPSTPHLDLATYPTPDLLRLLASLLQQIATANDQLRPEIGDNGDDVREQDSTNGSRSSSRQNSLPHPSPTTALFNNDTHPPPPLLEMTDPDHPLFSASRTSLAHPSSLLSFHARHVPSISIEAYLLRILKYCPTTNEVFLGLLVYFDRMSRLGTAQGVGGIATGARGGLGRGFAIDSYNIHRLVIAGVTVASKFFSDVFYTNSRYAKVGGLPPHELNQLELQFLLLNDFRLVIPSDEMQRYGDRLLGYWEGREADASADVDDVPVGHMANRGSGQGASAKNGQGVGTNVSEAGNVTVDAPEVGQSVEQESGGNGAVRTETAKTEDIKLETAARESRLAPDTSSRNESSTSDPPATASPPVAAIPIAPAPTPRSKERESTRPPSISFADTPSAPSGGLALGFRDWVRGDEVMGHMGGRMTSPMRD